MRWAGFAIVLVRRYRSALWWASRRGADAKPSQGNAPSTVPLRKRLTYPGGTMNKTTGFALFLGLVILATVADWLGFSVRTPPSWLKDWFGWITAGLALFFGKSVLISLITALRPNTRPPVDQKTRAAAHQTA